MCATVPEPRKATVSKNAGPFSFLHRAPLRGGLRKRLGYGYRRERFLFLLERKEAAVWIGPRSGYPPVCDRRSATLCAARFFFMLALAAAARLSAARSGAVFRFGCVWVCAIAVVGLGTSISGTIIFVSFGLVLSFRIGARPTKKR